MKKSSYSLLKSSIALLLLMLGLCSCQKETPTPPEEPALTGFKLSFPLDGAVKIPLKPTFKWESAGEKATYHLIASLKTDFSNPLIDEANLTSNSFTPGSELPANTRLYWKVTAKNAKGEQAAINAGIQFRTLPLKPAPSPNVKIYYVAPTGEDNPGFGTLDKPFATLAYAASMVPEGEGDSIYLAAGTYVETEPAQIPLAVSVVGAGIDKTILSSSGVRLPEGINPTDNLYKIWYEGTLIQLVSDHRRAFRSNASQAFEPFPGNQVLKGFTIDGKGKKLKAGVWVENRNNVTMRQVAFRDLAMRGAVFAPGDKNWYSEPEYYLKGIRIYDCSFVNCSVDRSDESLGALCLAQLDGAEIYNIEISETEGYGIKFIYDGYFKNTKVHDCKIRVNESDAKWGEDIAIELWNLGPGNEVYNIDCNTWLSLVNHPDIFGKPKGFENLKVHHIKMIDLDGNSSKEGIELGVPGAEVYQCFIQDKGFGIALWDMGRGPALIHHNIFYSKTPRNNWTGAPAIYIDNSKTWEFRDIRIYNNLFDGYRLGLRCKGDKISQLDIKNNLFLNAEAAEVEATGSGVALFNNLKFHPSATQWRASGVSTQGANLSGDPGLLNKGERWGDFYKPASANSLVLNKGVDVGLPFSGAAPNIGPY
jgi:hypothetical protein